MEPYGSKMSLQNIRIAYFIWAAGMIAVIILSLMPPGQNLPLSHFASDKIRHFICYALLAFAACQAGRDWKRRIHMCIVTFFISVLIEFLQPYTGRDFEVLDMLANLSGILTGISITFILLRWQQAHARP